MVDLTTFSNNVDSTRFEQTMQSTRTAGVKPLYISNKGIPKDIIEEIANSDQVINEGTNIEASLFFTKDGVAPAYSFIGDWVSNSSQVLVYYQLGYLPPDTPEPTIPTDYVAFIVHDGVNAIDATGNFSVVYDTANVSKEAGQFGNALNFNGTSGSTGSYLTLDSRPFTNSSYAYSFWKYRDVSSSYGLQYLFMSGTDGESFGTNFDSYRIRDELGEFTYFGEYGNGSNISEAAQNVFTDGVWEHVVFNTTPSSISVYIDGLLVSQIQKANDIAGVPDNFGIGVNLDGFVSNYTGSLENIRLYDRLLSEEEITLLASEE